MSPDTKDLLISYGAYLVGFFAAFALVGTTLSRYLFLWLDVAMNPAASHTALWVIYIIAIFVGAILLFFLRPHPVECFIVGILVSLCAGGVFVVGYENILIALAVAVLAVAGLIIGLRQGPLRAAYIGVSAGFIVTLIMFLVSANSLASVKGLSYSSSASDTTTALDWGAMDSTQRESFLAGVIQTEASRLNTGSVKAKQVILPYDVLATMSADGSVLVNYAAVRVQSPDADKIASYEQTYDSEWVYERLTSPDDITLAIVHSMAHVYQSQRVAGQVKEQRTWPYEDADEEDGSNEVLDEWADNLPVEPLEDVESYDNKLESQAWGYASSRLSSYID